MARMPAGGGAGRSLHGRRAKVSRNPSADIFQVQKVYAPIKGWWSTDAIANAPKGSALFLTNYFCEADAIRVRKGSVEHATGLTDSVETLMQYQSGSVSKMFGATTGGNVYDVTSAGAVGAAAISSLTNGTLQWVNFATAGGQFLAWVNGADAYRNFDGSSWSTPTLTGVTSSDLDNIFAHNRRLWFIEKNSTSAWYLPTDSVSGTVTEFNFGGLMTKGGYLVAGASWSVDAGDGADDNLVIITSEGEVLVYRGTDPSSASTWELQGVYEAGRPSGKRCFLKVGGDLAIITENGIMPISKILTLDEAVMSTQSLTRNIRKEYLDRVDAYFTVDGWQLVTKPKENMALVNVPTSLTTSQQLAMNTQTGAWSLFTGWDARCWIDFNGELYFGGADGKVYNAEKGGSDNGSTITAYCLNSYDDWGKISIKHVKGVRPIISSNVDINPGVGVSFDYDEPASGPLGSGVDAVTGFVWDTAEWDSAENATWPGYAVYNRWRGASGVGVAVAPEFRVDVTSGDTTDDLDCRFLAWHITYLAGNIRG